MNNNRNTLKVLLLDINKVCRTCLDEKDGMVNIFSSDISLKSDSTLIKLKDILNNVTAIKVNENDQMPSQICNDCILNAITAYSFRRQSINADIKLKEILKINEPTQSDNDTKKELSLTNTEEDLHSECDLNNMDVESLDGDDLLREKAKEEIFTENKNPNCESIDTTENANEKITRRKCSASTKIICGECNIELLNKSDLRKHIKKEHSNKIARQPKESKSPVCSICNQVFAQMQTLTRHMKIHQANQKNKLCTFCGKCFLRADDLKRHIRIHTGERPYACDQCTKCYKQSSELKEHQKSHSAEKHYMCTECGKSLATRNGLYVHMKVHRGEKNHHCKICNKKYVTSGELTSHINHIHSSQKPFTCSFEGCPRTFVTKLSLDTHVRAHTGEKPFKCQICDKSLATASGLHEHKRTHTGEKPKECNICNRRLGNSQALKKHIRIHTGERPYLCAFCPEKFICGSTLNTHIKTKHLDKQYKCLVCNKMFAINSKLRNHLRVHHSDKELKCKICNETFTTNNKYLEHIKQHGIQSTVDVNIENSLNTENLNTKQYG